MLHKEQFASINFDFKNASKVTIFNKTHIFIQNDSKKKSADDLVMGKKYVHTWKSNNAQKEYNLVHFIISYNLIEMKIA